MIHIQDLQYQYPHTSSPTLRQVSFEVGQGEIFGLLGPSGAGKSTTQKILTRLLHGYEGTVEVLGRPLKTWDEAYYRHIGVGFELPNHYPKLTAIENLELFAAFYQCRTTPPMKLLHMVGLEDAAHRRVEKFSKGMKMRLNFVRALLHDPEILFLDEPTSGLDPANARRIKDIILDLKQTGKTIILTTHRMNDAEELCDRVAFMVDGSFPLIASPRELMLAHSDHSVLVEFDKETGQSQKFPLADLGKNQAFLDMIREHPIKAIHSQEANLEQIFLQLTGQQLQ